MTQLTREQQIAALEKEWATNPRWKGIKRGYSAADVVRLRGSQPIEYTLARRGAEKLWDKVCQTYIALNLSPAFRVRNIVTGLVANLSTSNALMRERIHFQLISKSFFTR